MPDQLHHDRAPGALSPPVQLSTDEYREVRAALARGDHASVARLLARARARHSDSETPVLVWRSEPGACPACAAMSGRVVPPDGRKPPLHVNCRCSVVPESDDEPYAEYSVATSPDVESDYESYEITHGDRREGAPNMKNTTTAACACEHRDSEADAAAALRKRLAGAWREPDRAPANGSEPALSPVGTDERAVMRQFRERLANAWRGE